MRKNTNDIKYEWYKKVFPTKVIWYQRVHVVLLLVWPCDDFETLCYIKIFLYKKVAVNFFNE